MRDTMASSLFTVAGLRGRPEPVRFSRRVVVSTPSTLVLQSSRMYKLIVLNQPYHPGAPIMKRETQIFDSVLSKQSLSSRSDDSLRDAVKSRLPRAAQLIYDVSLWHRFTKNAKLFNLTLTCTPQTLPSKLSRHRR